MICLYHRKSFECGGLHAAGWAEQPPSSRSASDLNCMRAAGVRSRGRGPAATGGNYENKANNLHAVFECGRVVSGVGGGGGPDAGEPAAAATDNAEPAADAGPAGHEPGES